jgi:hypothetical protein
MILSLASQLKWNNKKNIIKIGAKLISEPEFKGSKLEYYNNLLKVQVFYNMTKNWQLWTLGMAGY